MHISFERNELSDAVMEVEKRKHNRNKFLKHRHRKPRGQAALAQKKHAAISTMQAGAEKRASAAAMTGDGHWQTGQTRLAFKVQPAGVT